MLEQIRLEEERLHQETINQEVERQRKELEIAEQERLQEQKKARDLLLFNQQQKEIAEQSSAQWESLTDDESLSRLIQLKRDVSPIRAPVAEIQSKKSLSGRNSLNNSVNNSLNNSVSNSPLLKPIGPRAMPEDV
jgi:hypothetical protein